MKKARSTIHRWIAAGLVPPLPRRRKAIVGSVPDSVAPTDWAAAIRAKYDLQPHEDVIVGLAEGALAIARDQAQRPTVRLAAMQRFTALLRDLNLPPDEETDGEAEEATNARTWPRPA